MLRFHTLFSLSTLAVLLSGCGGGSDSAKNVNNNAGSYSQQSCEYGFLDGGAVDRTVRASEVRVGYFDKAYDRAWLDAIGRSSIAETYAYILGLGAHVYRAPKETSSGCSPFDALDSMPSEIEAEWDRAEASILDANQKNGGTAFITGLYLPPSRSIIVREDANRWTLVHELMHHNFKSHAVGDDVRMQANRQALANRLESLLNDPTRVERDKVVAATPTFVQFVEACDRLLVDYPLEEVTVEATLQDQFDLGALTFVPKGAYASASWYIDHSRGAVDAYFASIDPLYGKLREIALKNELMDVYTKLGRYEVLKNQREAQLMALVTRHSNNAFVGESQGAPSSKDRSAVAAPSEPPCAEAVAGQAMIRDLTDSIARITL